ncbi:MAG TPA: MFS transporter [Armatimonadota bacterium]|jgi:MFS family permease
MSARLTAVQARTNGRLAILLLMGAAMSCDLSVNCRNLAAAFRAVNWHASPVELGILAASGPAVYTVGCLTLGHLSDRLGRRNSALMGLGLAALCAAGHYWSAEVWQLVVWSSIYGLAMSLFWPTTSAWFSELASLSPGALNRALGNFNVAWSSGMVLGAVIGGVLWRAIGPLTFLALVALLVTVGVALFWVPQRRPVESVSEEISPEAATPEPTVDPAVTSRFLVSARLVSFLSWFMTGVLLTILPKLASLLGMPENQTGLSIAAYYFAIVLLLWAGRTSSRWQYRLWPLILPAPLAVVGMGAVASARSLPMFLGACLIAGVCTALSVSTSLYYALHGRESGRAASTALHEAVVGLGGVTGGLVSGVLAESMIARLGLENALRGSLLLVAALAVVMGLAQLVVWPLMRRAAERRAEAS